jgi:hypothetical protein
VIVRMNDFATPGWRCGSDEEIGDPASRCGRIFIVGI